MKRTKFIELGLTSAMALALTGCNRRPQEAQRCVDSSGRVVQDYFCESQPATGGSGVFYPYRWYYGGRGYYPGEFANGGRDTPTPGAEALRSSSPGFSGSRAAAPGSGVTRGGFGGTAEGAGAGE